LLNSKKLKGRLVEQGLTQKDAAKCLGIAPATLSQKINGVRPLYLHEAVKLADLLKIDDENFCSYFFCHTCLRSAVNMYDEK